MGSQADKTCGKAADLPQGGGWLIKEPKTQNLQP